MNANRFRLVWNNDAGMLVPVWEGARARRKSGTGGATRAAVTACAALLSSAAIAADLPVLNQVVNGIVNVQPGQARLDVNLGSAKSIVHWNSFDIAKGNTVSFNNTVGGMASTLNRVVGLNKSQIDGALKTSGAVNLMLINANGIVFGKNAQVDVHSLIASALDIPDATFLNSIFSQAANAASSTLSESFSGGGNGVVEVEAGAVISTESVKGGKIVLIAPGGVENRGTIKTPDGQTILAAGTKAYFVPSEDTRMRGWLVQVDNGTNVTNLGNITAERGNVSMVGLAVKQGGTVSATTSVGANGSIWLLAGSNHRIVRPDSDLLKAARSAAPTLGGSIELGKGSMTQVSADATDTDSIDSNALFNNSEVLAVGASVDHYGSIIAPGGKVSMVAMADPSTYFGKGLFPDNYDQLARNSANRVTLHDNSLVDVSGYDIELPMSRNVIEVELRDQLKDMPLQRNSFLRGKTVKVDVRRGTPLADISTDLAAIRRGVGEKLSVGGTFESIAQGDTIVEPDAGIDVSGGTVSYAEGMIQTTKLQGMDGKLYDIGDADPNRLYRAIANEFTVSNPKFGSNATKTFYARGSKEEAYTDAQGAGTVRVQSHGIALAGDLKGMIAKASLAQRSPGLLPQGGTLELRTFLKDATALALNDKRQDVVWQDGVVTLDTEADGSLPEKAETRLSTGLVTSGGFGRIDVEREGKIDLPKGVDLDLAAGGSLALTGNNVTVAGDIRVPAGEVKLQARPSPRRSDPFGALSVAGGSTISVAGLWVNDWSRVKGANTLPWLTDAGRITLAGDFALTGNAAGQLEALGGLRVGDVTGNVAQAATLDLTGGGRVDTEGNIQGGKGGSLAAGGAVQWVADIRAKGLAGGGEFSIGGADVLLREASPTVAEQASAVQLILPAAMFSTLGFSDYSVSAERRLDVASGTRIDVQTPYLEPGAQAKYQPSGSNVLDSSSVAQDPAYRPVASLSLAAGGGDVRVNDGVEIRTDTLGALALTSDTGSIYIDGILAAPAGSVSLALGATPTAYDPARTIWLTDRAQILAAGQAEYTPNNQGLLSGAVHAGGNVTLEARRGFVISEAGALVDVSGSAGLIDVNTPAGLQRKLVGSDGGSLTIAAAEGFAFDADVRAGAPGSRGGSLNLKLDSVARELSSDAVDSTYPVREMAVDLLPGDAPGLPQLAFGDDLGALAGSSEFKTGRLAGSGADNFSVTVRETSAAGSADGYGTIRFGADQSIRVVRNLVLDANQIDSGGHVIDLAANYARLGESSENRNGQQAAAASAHGRFNVAANWIDLIGSLTLNGSAENNLSSAGDLRALGVINNLTEYRGRLLTSSDLNLTARQVYPASYSRFDIVNDSGTLSVSSSGSTPGPVLSAAGELTLRAPDIVQKGVVKAPQGRLVFDGGNSVTLAAGSVSSVSAEGQTVPLGMVQNGSEWVYPLSSGNTDLLTRAPEKTVSVSATAIDLAAGATVDVSGGGDVYAYEWLPGPGGSHDVLTPANSSGAFAVLAGETGVAAAYDPFYQQGADLSPGRQVYLSAVKGLKEGVYTQLPARYALLPGAYLVTPAAKSTDMRPQDNVILSDGSAKVAGYQIEVGTARQDSRWSGFVVESGSDVRNRAEYKDHLANTFYAEAARKAGESPAALPRDAGRVSLQAGAQLVLDGSLKSLHDAGARGAQIDISADKLAVVGAKDQAIRAGFVAVEAGKLSALGGESILLGGSRAQETAGTRIAVGASEVRIENSADTPLHAPEVTITASDKIDVAAGAVIEASGTGVSEDNTFLIGDVASGTSGDGALVRVANGADAGLVRSNSSGSQGTLVVAAGARIGPADALTFDATKQTDMQGDVLLRENGAINIGANRISLGNTAGVNDGFILDSARLAQLSKADKIALTSYSTVDFYGSSTLGSAGLETLAIRAAGINGYQAGNQVALQARSVVVDNANNSTAGAVGAYGDGSLTVDAERIEFGANTFKLRGFNTVNLNAGGDVLAAGSGTLDVARDDAAAAAALNISAARITGGKAADFTIKSTGVLTTARAAAVAASEIAAELGAKLTLEAQRITHGGRIDLPSGDVILNAKGISAGDGVALSAGGAILAQGKSVDFYDSKVYTEGGSVTLSSDHGGIVIEKDAVVDVSAVGADAGQLQVAAGNGGFTVDGLLRGAATPISGEAIPGQGRFSLDVGSLFDFGKLNGGLNAGGFSESRALRVRNGNVDIAADQSGANAVRAHAFNLAVDKGALSVAGEIDASGISGGAIDLYAYNDIVINPGAALNVSASGSVEKGGTVALGTGNGALKLDGGTIQAGGAAGNGGLTLRAPRGTNNDSVNVGPLATVLSGVGETVVEAVKIYDKVGSAAIASIGTGSSSGTRLGIDSVATDNDAFMANAANIKNALGKTNDVSFHVRPGVEVRATGDLTIANDLSLHGWRYDARTGARETLAANLAAGSNANGKLEAGALTLRAAGDLLINNSLSDGFNGASNTARLNSDGSSWRYRLIGGADHGAANPLAVKSGASTGDVRIAANKLVRTGAADIDVAAGRNFELQGKNDTSAVIYTAGVQSPLPADFAVSAYKDPTNRDFDIAKANFPVNGGDIGISAQNDVIGAITHQLFSEWLQRQGTTDAAGALLADFKPAWWINFDKFRQGVGALAGGNVDIKAGRDIANLSAVVPTTGRLAGAAGSPAKNGNLVVTGGGDLRVEAGRDILSGVFLAANGEASLRAGRDLKAGRSAGDTGKSSVPIHSIVGLMGSHVDIRARRDLALETAVNPTVIAQDSSVLPAFVVGKTLPQRSYFYTYAVDDRLDLQALTGELRLVNNREALQDAFATKVGARNYLLSNDGSVPQTRQPYAVYAPILNATAVQGNLAVERSMTLFPSARGNLELRAKGDVDVPNPVVLSDADPALLLNPFFLPQDGKHGPSYFKSGTFLALTGYDGGQAARAARPIHRGDDRPARIIALEGDLNGSFDLSKQARFYAGGDITNLNLVSQHTGADDVTSVVAEGSVKYSLLRNPDGGQYDNNAKLEISGPGTLYVQAGADIDLGNAEGILSKGDLINPALPADGANITLMSGVSGQPAYSAFMASYFGQAERSQAADWIRTALANPALSEAEALAAFSGMPAGQQLASPVARLAQARFYQLLGQAGRDKNNGKPRPYDEAYAAIKTLFPGTAGQKRATSPGHDISLLYSQIKTEDGGDTWMFVPRGQVNAGQTSAQAQSKSQDRLGIVVQDVGSIRAFVDQDFLVNQSKVFTLRGTPAELGTVKVSESDYELLRGDILIWSSHGDIDAGRGAKSAVSSPPPLLLTDPSTGETILKYTSVSGSGIRSFKTNKTDSDGLVSLIAPEGTVNAGDAGIGAQNINIAAVQVVGAGNIQVTGAASGVPTVSADGIAGRIGNIGNPAADVTKATESVSQALAESSKAAQTLADAFKPGFVSVEVIGFGE